MLPHIKRRPITCPNAPSPLKLSFTFFPFPLGKLFRGTSERGGRCVSFVACSGRYIARLRDVVSGILERMCQPGTAGTNFADPSMSCGALPVGMRRVAGGLQQMNVLFDDLCSVMCRRQIRKGRHRRSPFVESSQTRNSNVVTSFEIAMNCS